jgi:DNA-binding transcriptional MerR regulator
LPERETASGPVGEPAGRASSWLVETPGRRAASGFAGMPTGQSAFGFAGGPGRREVPQQQTDCAPRPPVTLNISAVERDTGLSKDTLRVWERRYGFPLPGRDAGGERTYSAGDLAKLRVLRRLIDAGYRPGKIIRQPLAMLQALAAQTRSGPSAPAHETSGELARFAALIRTHDIGALRSALLQAALRLGVARFVIELAAPLDRLVAQMQLRGEIELFAAGLYGESMQVVLRRAIAAITTASASPRVLLTSFPRQDEVRALLMVEALLALEGCRCLSLGAQMPVVDTARCVLAQEIDIVALPFSAALNPGQVLEGLVELRARLPVGAEIWAIGPCPVLLRRPPAGVRVVDCFESIAPELARWREAQAGKLGKCVGEE